MAGEGAVQIQVGSDLVKPIIEAKIHAAVVAELDKSGDLIPRIITGLLSQKVNSDGVHKGDSYYDKWSLLQWMSEKMIRETALSAIKEWIATQQPKLKAELIKQLDRQKASLAELMIIGLGEAMKNSWTFKCDVQFKQGKD